VCVCGISQLKEALLAVMKAKYIKKGTWETMSQGEAVATAIDELATATMKYTLLAANPRHKVWVTYSCCGGEGGGECVR